MMTYGDISVKYGISKRYLHDVVKVLCLYTGGRTADGGKTVAFDDDTVYQIVNYRPQKNDLKYNKRKIALIGYYQVLHNTGKCARMVKMDLALAREAVKEFHETGCVVVESKMNYPDRYELEYDGGEYYLYYDNEIVASTAFKYDLGLIRENIEGLLSYRAKKKNRYLVELCTTKNGKLWIRDKKLTIKNIK